MSALWKAERRNCGDSDAWCLVTSDEEYGCFQWLGSLITLRRAVKCVNEVAELRERLSGMTGERDAEREISKGHEDRAYDAGLKLKDAEEAKAKLFEERNDLNRQLRESRGY